MTVLAWIVAALAIVAYAVALSVGSSCAADFTPWCIAAFGVAFALLVVRYERKGHR